MSMSPDSIRDSGATLLIERGTGVVAHRLMTDATLGRDRNCAIVVDHPTVSRMHARIHRDAAGWHFQDLGSQNGSRLGDSRTGESKLREGAELHIGRVRAWFFAGNVPAGWTPPIAKTSTGKLIRCTCGHIGWASIRNGDGLLRCSACGREIIRRDPNTALPTTPSRPPPPPLLVAKPLSVAADCAACHSPITAAEASQKCLDCGATMHVDCWRENRGCATYGCSQVGVIDRADETTDGMPAIEAATTESNAQAVSHAAKHESLQSFLAVISFAAAGVPLFGVPAIGYAAYQLVGATPAREGKRRFVWASISVVAGTVGAAASAWWWLGWRHGSVGGQL